YITITKRSYFSSKKKFQNTSLVSYELHAQQLRRKYSGGQDAILRKHFKSQVYFTFETFSEQSSEPSANFQRSHLNRNRNPTTKTSKKFWQKNAELQP